MPPKFRAVALPGDLIVNRVPEDIAELKLGYKLALGKVVKSGIPTVAEGDLVIFALQDAKEFSFPAGMRLDFEPSELGMFLLRDGIRFGIVKDEV
ncbi:MAG: hypothetical protein ABSC15_27535 [Terriglobales bacterium]|jgi:hypothetical protein